MENLCKGVVLGMVVGVCVGGILVAKNKKLANKINQTVSTASDKFQEAKEMIEEKMQEKQEEANCISTCDTNNCNCEPYKNQFNTSVNSEKDFSKKSKN